MITRKINIVLIIFVLTVTFASCSSKLLKETIIINKNVNCSFLIAGDSSEFKDEIRKAIIEKYKDQCSIEIVNVEKLTKISEKDYELILIMLEIQGWGVLNQEMRDFIDKTKQKEKIILFATSLNPFYNYDYEGIDAVTSASDLDKKDEIINKLTIEIDKAMNVNRY